MNATETSSRYAIEARSQHSPRWVAWAEFATLAECHAERQEMKFSTWRILEIKTSVTMTLVADSTPKAAPEPEPEPDVKLRKAEGVI